MNRKRKKTSSFSSLVTQMIAARDRAVIIIDPKDDPALRERSRLDVIDAWMNSIPVEQRDRKG